MHWLHKWSKWRPYMETGMKTVPKTGQTFPYQEMRQSRVCLVCGRVQDEFIKDGAADTRQYANGEGTAGNE